MYMFLFLFTGRFNMCKEYVYLKDEIILSGEIDNQRLILYNDNLNNTSKEKGHSLTRKKR